jgi:decaprenylphospho-beta-D-ribofuranose 2-oxidase
MPGQTIRLTGWGRLAPTTATLCEPTTAQAVAGILADAGQVIPRGLGRSYNNAAQCAGGTVLSTARLNRIISLDAATGVVVAQAGVPGWTLALDFRQVRPG